MLEKIKKAFGNDFEIYKDVMDLSNYGEVHLFDGGLAYALCDKEYMTHVGYDFYVHKELIEFYELIKQRKGK